jgi:DNA-binding SARP family transcriptional activator
MKNEPEPASFHFYLLGELVVRQEGERLPPPPHRLQGLLAALLLQPRAWQREQLVGVLFPGMSERRGRKRLSHLLWQLRQELPQLPLEATPHTLQLPAAGVWLDVSAFRRAAGSDDLEEWLEALALCRGDLLEGVYDDWLLAEREALYLRYVHLAHRACDALGQQGRFEDLLPHAERLVQREPFDERALRTLMKAYQALGRRGAALAAYERCVSLLQDELGTDPEPATQALAQALQSPTCPSSHSPIAGGDESADALLCRAREALVWGNAVSVRSYLQHLHDRSDLPAGEVRLLEIDLALLVEAYDRAADLLERPSPAPLSLRERLRAARLALGRRDGSAARDLALEVLIEAHEVADRDTELGALLVLTSAQQQLGQGVHAARSAERALALARENGLSHGVSRVLFLQGKGHLLQGRYTQARACFHEARSVALEHDLPYDRAMALRGLRVVMTYTQALNEALATAREELRIWRDLGLERGEAVALEGISLIQGYLGRSADSLRTLAQAQEISRRLGEPVRMAINRYNLASTMMYHDDNLAPRAVEVARQALEAFRAHNQPTWEASTLTALGYALWVDGQHAAALGYFRQAYAISEQVGELLFVPELLAYQGLAQLGLGEPVEALALTRRAVTSMAHGDVSDEVVPEICYAHAMALAANGREERARVYFERAYESLLDGAAQVEDEEARQAFFHRSPTTRRLMRELRARSIAPPPGAGVRTVQLPAARGGGPLRVHWTVDAGPADTALKRAEGAIALRRARLARLLEEAQVQGATPSTADLAQALNVSQRTIQRDLTTLRSE